MIHTLLHFNPRGTQRQNDVVWELVRCQDVNATETLQVVRLIKNFYLSIIVITQSMAHKNNGYDSIKRKSFMSLIKPLILQVLAFQKSWRPFSFYYR